MWLRLGRGWDRVRPKCGLGLGRQDEEHVIVVCAGGAVAMEARRFVTAVSEGPCRPGVCNGGLWGQCAAYLQLA